MCSRRWGGSCMMGRDEGGCLQRQLLMAHVVKSPLRVNLTLVPVPGEKVQRLVRFGPDRGSR